MQTPANKKYYSKEENKEKKRDIKVLKETIIWFKKQIEPHDCGWMHTTIGGLNHRIKYLKKEIHDQRK